MDIWGLSHAAVRRDGDAVTRFGVREASDSRSTE